MKLLLFTLYIIPVFLFGQTKSISGNVFYKYNEFVGSRPDAGASIILLKQDDVRFSEETIADVDGNYKFDGLLEGRYLAIVKSKNTNVSEQMGFTRLDIYKDIIAYYIPEFPSLFSGPLYDSVMIAKNELKEYVSSKKYKTKKYYEMDLTLTKTIYRFFSKIPIAIHNRLGLIMPTHKLVFEVVTLNESDKKIVTDFGITYSK